MTNRLTIFTVFLICFLACAKNSVAATCQPYSNDNQVISAIAGPSLMQAFNLYGKGDITGALQLLKTTEAKNKYDRAYTDMYIGKIVLAQGEESYKDGIVYLKQALQANILNKSDHLSSIKMIADILLSIGGKEQDATDYYRLWLNASCEKDADVYMRMANAEHTLKHYSSAAKYAEQSLDIKPSKNAYEIAYAAYYEMKQYKKAARLAEKLFDLNPEEVKYKSQQIMLMVFAEEHQGAQNLFVETLKSKLFTPDNPEHIQLFRLASNSFSSTEKYPMAFHLRKVILPVSKQPFKDLDSMISMGSLGAFTPKNVDITLDSTMRFVDKTKQASLLARLGRVLAIGQYSKRAITILEHALSFKDATESYSIFMSLAYAYEYQNAIEQGLTHVNKALAIEGLQEQQKEKAIELKQRLEAAK